MVVEKDMKLFAHVFFDTLNPPKQIMLQFHRNWEQRVIGENKIVGKEGTASCRMGKLPETGKWVRLEVDVMKVDLSITPLLPVGPIPTDGKALGQVPSRRFYQSQHGFRPSLRLESEEG